MAYDSTNEKENKVTKEKGKKGTKERKKNPVTSNKTLGDPTSAAVMYR